MSLNRWIEVNLGSIVHNYRLVRGLLDPDTRLMAVVKANAYGLGMVPVAKVLAQAGADWLGVTQLEEGLALRSAGIDTPCLLFAPLLDDEMAAAVSNNLAVSISSPEQVEWLSRAARSAGLTAAVHVKVETGLGRSGLFPETLVSIARRIASDEYLRLEGIYTHFAKAAKDERLTRRQFEVFERAVKQLEQSGLSIPLVHCANSAALLRYPEMQQKMVRVGTLLYGQYPGGRSGSIQLQDPWRARVRIIYLRQVPPGTGIGYGHEFVAKKKTYIGIIPVGFADGLGVTAVSRAKSPLDLLKMLAKTLLNYLGWKADLQVLVKGRAYPVVGRVGMQLSMVDFGEECPVETGDVVDLPIRRTTAASTLKRRYLGAGEKETQAAGRGIKEE